MNCYRINLLVIVAILSVSTAACELDAEQPLASAQQASAAANGLSANGLPMNGLPMNGLPMNGLPMNGLPMNGLPMNGLPAAAMQADWDSWLRDIFRGSLHNTLMRYIARCALSAGNATSFSRDDAHWKWNGEIGLADEWANGQISGAKARWVTSCVLSLVNAAGQNVIVSQRSRSSVPEFDSNPAYTMAPAEALDYTVPEGAYFGNMFADPPAFFACKAPGYTGGPPGRSCTLEQCGAMTVTALECDQACDVEQRTVDDQTFDVYYNCTADGVTYYPEATTVYVP